MNTRELRKMAAANPAYMGAIEKMAERLSLAVACGMWPRFRMPPAEVVVPRFSVDLARLCTASAVFVASCNPAAVRGLVGRGR